MLPPNVQSISQITLFIGTYSLATYVSISAALLFWVVHRRERQLKTPWRAIGFFLLAVSFAVAISALFAPKIFCISLLIEILGFAAIGYGVRKELILSHLRHVPGWYETHPKKSNQAGVLLGLSPALAVIGGYAIAAVIIAATVALQVQRYIMEPGEAKVRWQNLYPLFAYLFLFIRCVLLIMYATFPDATIIWLLAMLATDIAFAFLAVWAWIFIRIRRSLRTSVVLIALTALAATVAILATTALIILFFQILFTRI